MSLSVNQAVEQVQAVLREAVEGGQQPLHYFTDGGAENSLSGVLAKISAAAASRPVAGSSIAAHARHTVFGMRASAAWIRGDHTPREWQQSWSETAVDDAAWASLQGQIKEAYDDLQHAINIHSFSLAANFGGALGAAAHIAYHLGAIRQKLAFLKGDGPK